MRSTFYGLDIANKGLFVAQRQIDLTGHNISNANTEGYTRQRFVTTAVDPSGAYSQWAPINKGTTGGGVQTLTIDQIRDKFLDKQYRNENTRTNYWETRNDALYYVEDVFRNLDKGGLSDQLSSFFSAIQELSKNATDGAVRTEVIERAKAFTETLHANYEQLKSLMYQQDDMLVAETKRINDIGQQLTELNQNILKFELSGSNANDLRDKRNLLLDELSGLADISYQEVDSGKQNVNGLSIGTLVVKIGGDTFVNHNTYRAVTTQQDLTNDMLDMFPSQPVPNSDKLHSVRFADDNSLVNLTGGKMKAYIDMRDGNVQNNQGIPYFKAQLDKLAKGLVETFNAIHETGYTMPYTDSNSVYHPSQTGIPFFDPAGLTIDTITLSSFIKESPFNVAAAQKPVVMDAAGHYETGNNEVGLALAKLKLKSDLPVLGGFESYYSNFITELASEVSHAGKMTDQEYSLLDGLGAQRASVSGVSVDEEMTNLIRFQHAYNAAARAITAMDEALDVLINRTGRVGL